jgi:hypothetical protein
MRANRGRNAFRVGVAAFAPTKQRALNYFAATLAC